MHQRGFTLIELLISVALIALLSGVLLLSSGLVTRDRTPDGEAARVLRLLHLFRHQAVNTAQDLGLYLDGQRLLFMARTPEGWQGGYRVAGRDAYELAGDLHPALDVDGRPVDSGGEERLPHIIFLSDGQISPFSLRLNGADAATAITEQLERIPL